MLLFEHLNLRHNPFETPTLEDWARLAVPIPGFDAESLAQWLREPRRAVLILGECGRGKSTHAQAIRRFHPDAPWVYIGPGERPKLPEVPLLFVDEAQRLGWWRRRKLWRRDGSFVVTSHADHTSEMRSAGLEVRTFRVADLSPGLLSEILETRIEWARRGPGEVPTFAPEAVERLIADFGDDLRAMLDVLYDYVQEMPGPQRTITLDDELYRGLADEQPPSQHKFD